MQRASAQSEPTPVVPAPAAPEAPAAPLVDPDAGVPQAPVEDAAVLDQDAAVAPELEVAPPPVTTATVIEGTITSLGDGSPVAAAKIYVRGEPLEAESGTDGRFTLTVEPGMHRLSVIHGLHETQTVDVEALAGQTSTIAIELTPAELEYDDFLVTAPRIRGTVAATLQERRESAQVVDAISVADISKSPDGTASAATRRIVGATIVGGQYLYVRGLGGRYTNVRLNGVPLPSTDPDLPGFQLDLFPANLLSSLNVAKTFTPDIPANFAGGSMNIVTRDFPDDFTLTASIGASTTTAALNNTMYTYDGGNTDFLGFDDGTRDKPDAIKDVPLIVARRGDGFTKEEVGEISRDFRGFGPIEKRGWFPNLSASLSVGDSTKVFGRRLGVLASLGYRYNLQVYDESLRKLAKPDVASEGLKVIDAWVNQSTNEKALIGLLGSASYELATGHDVTLVSMLTQNSEDKTTSQFVPLAESTRTPQSRTQFRFISRQLFFNQLLGHHDFSAAVFDWQLNASTVHRDQPDTIDLFRSNDRLETLTDTTRFWSELDQVDLGGGLDVTVPIIDETKLKAGYMGRIGDRLFSARSFAPNARGFDSEDDLTLPSEEFLDPSNGGVQWIYDEGTHQSDAFKGDEQLHAGYAMLDTPTISWLRVTGGARVEASRQAISTGSKFVQTPVLADEIELANTDVLPALALTAALTEAMNLRAAYGATVARPVMRELAPVFNTDFVRKRNVIGEPDLNRTYIHNFDLRWELFPSDIEVFAASVFYKVFMHPIESVITPNNDYSFMNIKGARNYGAELEARVGLDRIWEGLEGFSLGGNFALIESQIELRPDEQMIATSSKRSMAGQSPYVANLSLGYSDQASILGLNVFYNVFGRRIRDAGIDEMPDTYEEEFHSLDFSATYKLGEHFTLGASATNILFQPVRVTQGDFVISRYSEGLLVGLNLGFKN